MEEVILDKRSSDTRRAGAIQYAVYTGSEILIGEDFKKYRSIARNVNELLVRQEVEPLLVSGSTYQCESKSPHNESSPPTAVPDLQMSADDSVVPETIGKQVDSDDDNLLHEQTTGEILEEDHFDIGKNASDTGVEDDFKSSSNEDISED